MTRDEVEKAIPLAFGGIIEKCLLLAARHVEEDRERIFGIAREAEAIEARLLNGIRKVKVYGHASIDHPDVWRIKEILNTKTMEFHRRLEQFALSFSAFE